MRNQTKLLPILLAILTSLGAAASVRAQSDYTNYGFVVFETTVTRKDVPTSDSNPSERRFYVSNVVEFPERDRSIFRNAGKIADEYFIANLVEPLAAKGILHNYYDDAIKINNRASYVETRAEVEDLRKQVLEDLKEQNANVFTFTWTRDKAPKGLETSKPTLFSRGAEQPLLMPGDKKR
jgi:hypothetical protein